MPHWIDARYIYRRVYEFTSPGDVLLSHPVTVTIPVSALNQGKIRSEDFEDIEAVYETDDATPVNIALYREVEYTEGDDVVTVHFALQNDVMNDEVNDQYYVYYGNPDLENQPIRVFFTGYDGGSPFNNDEEDILDAGGPTVEGTGLVYSGAPSDTGPIFEWPEVVPYTSNEITYTRPGEHWVEGRTTASGARANLNFHGTQVRITSTTGSDKGIMEVRIDQGSWEQIDLFSSFESDEIVFEAHGLSSSVEHQITIRATGSGSARSVGNEVNVVSLEYRKPVNVESPREEVVETAWTANVGGV